MDSTHICHEMEQTDGVRTYGCRSVSIQEVALSPFLACNTYTTNGTTPRDKDVHGAVLRRSVFVRIKVQSDPSFAAA